MNLSFVNWLSTIRVLCCSIPTSCFYQASGCASCKRIELSAFAQSVRSLWYPATCCTRSCYSHQLLTLQVLSQLASGMGQLASVLGPCMSPYPGTAAAQVPMFSASGLRVQYLKVWEKSSYKVDKWVRKVCRSGDYNVRI